MKKADINVCLIGRPNTGKSTLLNSLLNNDRSITSDIPGTTIDSIRDCLEYKNRTIAITDTPGNLSSLIQD